jgi:hypothetical protein
MKKYIIKLKFIQLCTDFRLKMISSMKYFISSKAHMKETENKNIFDYGIHITVFIIS